MIDIVSTIPVELRRILPTEPLELPEDLSLEDVRDHAPAVR